MTPRIETEALQALAKLAPLTVTSQSGDPEEGFRGIVGPEVITKSGKPVRFYVAQYVFPENAQLFAAAPSIAAEALEAREVIPHMGDLIAHFAAQAATAEHWRQVSVDSLVVVTGLRAELKGTKLALEQAWASNRERDAEIERLRARLEDRIHDC